MNAFVSKLGHGAHLTQADQMRLLALLGPMRRTDKGRDIPESGNGGIPLILKGWACRYQLLANGKRQIVSLYLPGDLCQPFGILPDFSDYPVGALTPVAYSLASRSGLLEAAEQCRSISTALWWDLLVAANIEREHIVSLGRRSAVERLGHLFCEIMARLRMSGLSTPHGIDMPLTQNDLGDLLGLTPVHVNRSLQDLRKAGLISLESRRLVIRQPQELQELSHFDSSYLHGGHGTANFERD